MVAGCPRSPAAVSAWQRACATERGTRWSGKLSRTWWDGGSPGRLTPLPTRIALQNKGLPARGCGSAGGGADRFGPRGDKPVGRGAWRDPTNARIRRKWASHAICYSLAQCPASPEKDCPEGHRVARRAIVPRQADRRQQRRRAASKQVGSVLLSGLLSFTHARHSRCPK